MKHDLNVKKGLGNKEEYINTKYSDKKKKRR